LERAEFVEKVLKIANEQFEWSTIFKSGVSLRVEGLNRRCYYRDYPAITRAMLSI